MFVVSVKPTKKKIIIISAVILVILSFIIVMVVKNKQQPTVTASGIDLTVDTAEKKLSFFRQYGWQVDNDPIEIVEVIIPEEFNQIYDDYNQIQLKQEMDLEKYKGKRVKKWTYKVENYTETDEPVYASILVYNNIVIGGGLFTKSDNPMQTGLIN